MHGSTSLSAKGLDDWVHFIHNEGQENNRYLSFQDEVPLYAVQFLATDHTNIKAEFLLTEVQFSLTYYRIHKTSVCYTAQYWEAFKKV